MKIRKHPLLTLLLVSSLALAQNYKVPTIDASGKMYDKNGKMLGSLTRQGEIRDAQGTKIGYIDANGALIDPKTGRELGKAAKNGNYVSYFSNTPDKRWTTGAPMNGTCLVKDNDGHLKAVVHENYKQFGACAMHCLQNHMNHNQVLDKRQMAAVYTCPMHPEVVADKAGKCPKCGMVLVKK